MTKEVKRALFEFFDNYRSVCDKYDSCIECPLTKVCHFDFPVLTSEELDELVTAIEKEVKQ